MRRGAAILLSCGLLLGAFAAIGHAQFVDNFDYANNAALQAAWGAPVVGGTTGTSFTYNAGGGKLSATEMADADATGGYATAIFSRATSFSGNFVARMEFDWNQSETPVLGAMFLEVRGPSGVIASGGLGDDTGAAGHAYMQVGGQSTYLGPNGAYIGGTSTFEAQTGAIATSFNNAAIAGGAGPIRAANSLGHSGTARLDILRFGDQIRVVVDNGSNVFSLGPIAGSTESITSMNLVFAGFAFGGGPANVLVGDTGTHLAVDKVVLEAHRNPGDADGVGGVTIADYQIIQANSFTKQIVGNNGDVNYDGFVDFNDFHQWKTNFPGGVAAAEAAIAALPEPTSLGLLACGMGLLLMKRRMREA